LDSGWLEPKTSKPEDIEAAERARQFKVNVSIINYYFLAFLH
jgi:hypothetical protein